MNQMTQDACRGDCLGRTTDRSTRTRWSALACWATVIALQACGGGGGDGSTPVVAAPAAGPAPAPAAAPGPAAAPAPAGADITCGLADFEAETLRLINERRAAGAVCGSRGSFAPAPAVVWQAQLTTAAYGHSRDMADNDYFSHDSQDGRTMANRVTAAGYRWSTVGENIAAGYGTVRQTVDAWMASEGHCANMMNPRFTEFGLACARNDASQYRLYWTLDLGSP